MIQQQVDGQNLSEHYRRLTNLHNTYQRLEAEEAEDYAIMGLTVSALIEHQEQAYHLAHYGTFQVRVGMALKSSEPDRILDRIYLHVKPFAQGRIAMQTNTKVIDFILALLNGQEKQVRTALHENKYRKILDIALCLKILEDDNHPAHRSEPSILWHPDFHPRKIMMTQQRFFGDDPMDPLATTFRTPHSNVEYSSGDASILGWDGALALPRIMTRCPPSFLWEECPQISAGCREKVIKVRFDTLVERKLPGYCADAYGEMERIIRAVGMYAVLGFNVGWKELPFESLMIAWERYVAGKMAVRSGRWHRGEYLWGR
ncbi:hypothetical protein EYC80_004454 [Monilinia laxa]|uniref:Aminoglycoside phosphotransferase domain-containing protein n=1 Tax=Monilinia laxa TaxID=61186 RepID=A0A5N6KMX0_MONLA|nr:hypothetical protein EYC80_004454 [Monilinia laxa]